MQLLLDTHALLWWVADSPRLPEAWRTAMGSPENRVLVSAASIWEIAIKAGSRRLQLDLPPRLELDALVQACGFEDLPIRAAHAAAVRSLPPHHADLFDRILVAQATVERLILISADRAIQSYDVELLHWSET